MEKLSSLFTDPSGAAVMHGCYNPGLVLLSLFVSIFSATMALQTAQIARRAESAKYRFIAISTGAIALGGGIWTMHFIGMLSFRLPMQIHYATGLTLLSLMPACAASWLALYILSRDKVTWPQLAVSGFLVGLGIGVMHYTGMAAMQMAAMMRYDPLIFGLSIVVAVSLSILSLWLRYGLHRLICNPTWRHLISGTVMGLAIAGMHYTGMAAVRFIGDPGHPGATLQFNAVFVSLVLSSFTITVTVLVAALNGLIRSRELYCKMEEGQSRLNAILDTAVDGIITIDCKGLIQSFNHSAERLFGWSAEEVCGHNIKMLMPEPDQSRHDSYLQNYHDSGVPKIIGTGREVMALKKDGTLMPIRLAVGRVNLPNELLFVGFVTDITDRHMLEASLRETAERAEQAAAIKSTFLANMSHEIRTPMNSIIGFTELLLHEDLTSVQRTHLNTIRQSSISLLRLLNDILDITKMEKSSMSLETIDFSLKELAFQIEASLGLGARTRHLTLRTDYPADMPEYFLGDPLRLHQILTNLVSNAIKFTERGGVEVRFSHDGSIIHIQVCDSGIGMTKEQVETIFAPFTQADASISRHFGGTGLGTTIARQLIELMGGDIQVESEPGCGSIFHVRLPLPQGKKPEVSRSGQDEGALPPLHVLIADDVALNIELLTLTLTREGHTVVAARNGAEAVEKFIAGSFDVVLMDVHMPETDGLQATRQIREYERAEKLAPTPVIALTASVMVEDRRAARQAGMSGFAVKPLDIPRLFDEIRQVLHLEKPSVPASGLPKAVTASVPVIDWPGGIALWGGKPRLSKAIRHFLDTVSDQHPLPAAGQKTDDWPQILHSAHGIHGAAGNLALPALAEQAGTLEAMIRAESYDDARRRLPELRRLIEMTEKELMEKGDLSEITSAAAPAASGEELLDQMQELADCLSRSELNDDALDAVCAGLKRDGHYRQACELRAATEAFEFEEAHTLLKGLLKNDMPPVARNCEEEVVS